MKTARSNTQKQSSQLVQGQEAFPEKWECTQGPPPPHLVGHVLLRKVCGCRHKPREAICCSRDTILALPPPRPHRHAQLCHIPVPPPPGADGTGQPCPGGGDACCLQLAVSQGFTSAHTSAAQSGTAHQIISHPKAWESRHPNSGTPASGCAGTTPGKRRRAGLPVRSRKGPAFANEPPQVKSSTQRQLAYGNQLPDQKKLLNRQARPNQRLRSPGYWQGHRSPCDGQHP